MRSPPHARRGAVLAVVLAALSGTRAGAADAEGAGAGDAATAGATRSLTLAEALDLAHAHSARLAALAARGEAAAAGADLARARRWPQVGVSAGYTRYSDVPELTIAVPGLPQQTVFPNIPDQYRARAALGVPLYTGGRLTAGIDAADAERAAARAELDAGAADLTLETTAAYLQLTTARESARVLAESIGAFETHLRDAREQERVGVAARNDVLAVEVERDRAVLSQLEAESLRRRTNADLLRLVGLPGAPTLEPAVPPAPPAPPPAPLDALVRDALAARPERIALASRIEAADAAVRGRAAGYLPQASLDAGYDYARPNRRTLPLTDEWDDSWDVGVTVSLDVFDFGRTRAAVDEARAEAEALRRQLEDLDRAVRQDVTARALALDTALAALPVAERALVSATENARVAGERYRAGVGPSSDLLDAEVGALRAALDRLAVHAAAHLDAARLERALGGR